MNLGKRIAELRKEKKWSQTDLAKAMGGSREAVGKYEREEITPSIEAAKNMANALGVTLDYLVGESELGNFDKKNIKRLQEIEHLPADVQEKMFFFIDTVLRDTKAKQAYID